MKRIEGVFFVIILLLVVSLPIFSALTSDDEVKTIVKIKEDVVSISASSYLNIDNMQAVRGDEFISSLTKSEIAKLKENPDVEIRELIPLHAFLQNSTKIIGANSTWPIQVSGINLTGTGQSVCVIDTGVNSSHPDLIGKVIATYCYCSSIEGANASCCSGNLSSSSNADDNNGHGTHVSGIIAASGGITGVAPSSNVVAIKILNSSGDGNSYDLGYALDWCVYNSSVYNISVISLSLGGGANSSYCDSMDSSITNSINSAVAKNISVVIASGNANRATQVSWPACIQNATSIGATTKTDAIASYSNRWALPMLFAPGSSINSTWYTGSYYAQDGTSMATPHVAGAIAIINQYLKLFEQTKTPKQIENLLNNTGTKVTDSNGINYSRINLYNAINNISALTVILVSPANNLITKQNKTFSCNVTSASNLANVSFYLWNSTALINNSNISLAGLNNVSNFSYNFTYEDSYRWNCLFVDVLNSASFASSNFSLTYDLTSPSISLISPINNSYQNAGRFNVSLNENGSCRYSLNNGINNITMNSSDNRTFFDINFSLIQDRVYNVSYYCNDTAGNGNVSAKMFFTIDLTSPNVTLISPSDSYGATDSQTIIFQYNVSDNLNISRCDLIVNGALVSSNSSEIGNSTNNISYLVGIGSGQNWSVNCTDFVGNIGNSSIRTFTINNPSPPAPVSSGGGGGGGSSSGTTYSLTESQTIEGINKELVKGDKIKFVVSSSSHTLLLNKVDSNVVNVTISSNPINLILELGRVYKLSLNSSDYYDLQVKLEGISGGEANVTLRAIHEQVNPPIISSNVSVADNASQLNRNNVEDKIAKNSIRLNLYEMVVLIIVFVLVVLIFWFVLKPVKKRKKNKD